MQGSNHEHQPCSLCGLWEGRRRGQGIRSCYSSSQQHKGRQKSGHVRELFEHRVKFKKKNSSIKISQDKQSKARNVQVD